MCLASLAPSPGAVKSATRRQGSPALCSGTTRQGPPGMQLKRVREPFIAAIEQTRQRLEERPVVLVWPDGSGNPLIASM